MAWNLKGQLIESCSCNMFCPCWFGVQDLMVMDQGWCASVMTLRIEEGNADGVSLDGQDAVITVDFPGPTLFDGGATARIFIDESADDEQFAALEPIMQGKQGGPMENIDPLVSTWLSTKKAKVGVEEEGERITVSADGAGRMHSDLLRDPEGNAFTLTGGGFVGGLGFEEVQLAPTGADWADDEMPRSFETKSGARGAVSWAG